MVPRALTVPRWCQRCRGHGAARAARPWPRRRGDREEGKERAPEPKIEELLKEGQDVIVQVAKEPLGTKGARLTCHVTLPGRFLVFMPTVDHIGISRKIDSRDERARLRGIVKEFREQHHFSGGVIIRTAASSRSKDDILADLKYFYKIWVDMRQRGEQQRSPVTVYQEPSLVAKLLRDLLTDDYSAIRIDNPVEHQRALEFIGRIMPSLAPRVKLYDKDFPIFEEYGVQAELDKALRSKVWLKSGGSIVINQTEALVAIDVNTGRYVGKKTAGRLEDTIIKTNLEAVKEIVRQIRLRDLGGIIVCDFIDMEEKKNRQKVFGAVEQELRKDRAPSKALQVSDFGLVIVTRKRVKQSLERVLTEPCPYCSGAGTIKSSATVCYEILSEVKKVGADLDGPGVLLRVNPDIARALQEEERGVLKDLKDMLRQGRHRQARRAPASRAVRRDVDRRLATPDRRAEAGVPALQQSGLSSCNGLTSLRRGRQVNQVADAAAVDPDAQVFVALQHFDLRAGSARAGASGPAAGPSLRRRARC